MITMLHPCRCNIVFADNGDSILSKLKSMGFPRNEFITEAIRLGRSQEFITEALAYADALDNKGLPVIFDVGHLAFILNKDMKEMALITMNASQLYRYFAIKKRNGGLRRIMAPYRNLQAAQLWIKESILDKIQYSNCVTAFVSGRNTSMNAKAHEGRKYVLKFDLKDFFESINIVRVISAFRWMGYDGRVALCLARICTAKIDEYNIYKQLEDQPEVQALFEDMRNSYLPFLMQGAPTSLGLANIVCGRLDKRLNGYALKHGISYTRYADDITFSSDDKVLLPSVNFIRKVVNSEGFLLNEKKTELLHEGNRQIVTGLLIDGHVRVPGRYKRDIMRHIHFCQKFGGRAHFHRIAPFMAYGKEWLEGRIRYVYSVEPEAAQKMWKEFEKIDWGI